MHSYKNLKDKLKRYGKPTKKEVLWLCITAIVLGFIFSFRQWGTTKFNIAIGMQNFLVSIVIVFVVLSVNEAAQRISALIEGYRTSYKPWIPGLVIGLLLTFLSDGRLIFLVPGAAAISFLGVHRLGKSFYAENYKHLGWIAMSGPIAVMVLAIILRALYPVFESEIILKIVRICVWIALFSMIPAPHFNGLKTFFGSRYVYIFIISTMVCCALLLNSSGIIISIIGSIVLGVLLLAAFFVYIDKRF